MADTAGELAALEGVAARLAEHDGARAPLVTERDRLIRGLTALGVGATTVARAAGVSTTLVYKVTERASR